MNINRTKNKPNILFIITDQQHAGMLSCTGNKYVKTEAIDRIASLGTRFEKAYCTNPVCVPSRFSLFTGRMPSEIGMRRNEDVAVIKSIPEHIKEQGLGNLLRKAGYRPVYGGKQHLPKMTVEDIGFDVISTDERHRLALDCAEYIKKTSDNPFFLTASFINPHDICLMALRDYAGPGRDRYIVANAKKEIESLEKALKLPVGVSYEKFMNEICPPLPDNFLPQQDEPEIIGELLKVRSFRNDVRKYYTGEQWRMHRWAYARLTERVDREIQIILDVLEESGKLDNTVIIFTSDHGDMDSSHKMEHKSMFYEESARIPGHRLKL